MGPSPPPIPPYPSTQPSMKRTRPSKDVTCGARAKNAQPTVPRPNPRPPCIIVQEEARRDAKASPSR
ncbi:hypothetical protein HD806DRAFT_520720 [Xylariaceae sp. AK1471]|nr:hypothetical protein HD806DRAFT_520720 [Xylariaceae sp. AK1471]